MSLSIEQCREILGKTAEKMTNSEVEELRNVFIALSDLAIDSYLTKKVNVNYG